ncbi:hypothetical protein E5D57_000015 [Metarhizium anisopliae]|nr:hypothetical protein E5D57_000015 [Metarhizium anisopliae]
MVHIGRRPKACQACKKRKVKCVWPWLCTRCIESGRNCTTPRDGEDITARHKYLESFSRKFEKNKALKALSQDEEVTAHSPNAGSVQLHPSAFPEMPLPERVIAFFMYHYDLESPSQNKTDDMGVILLKSDEAWEHYRLAFEACAMASFINETGGQLEYKSLTIATYNKALMAMHSALQDPDVVYEDATLAAVLLLALFECLNPTTGEQESWRNHVQGAIELARGPGRKQTDTRIGHMLFRATRTLMVIYSLATLEDEKNKELWWSEDDEYTSTQQLCVGVASLGAEATALLGPSGRREVVEVMLKRCQAHDRACKARWEELSKSTQGISSNNTDPWLLMLLNMLTCARILLNSIIMRCATWIYKVPNYQTSEEYDGACSALAEIILHSAKVNEQQLCWAEEAQSSFAELDVQLQPGRDSSRCAINKWIEDNRNLWEEKPLVGLQPLAVIWSLECLNDDQKIAIDTQLQRIVGTGGALPLHDDGASMPSYWFTVEETPCSSSYNSEVCCADLRKSTTDPRKPGVRDSAPHPKRTKYTEEDRDALLDLYQQGTTWQVLQDRFPSHTLSSLKSQVRILRESKFFFTDDEDRTLIRLREEECLEFGVIAQHLHHRPVAVSRRYKQLRPGSVINSRPMDIDIMRLVDLRDQGHYWTDIQDTFRGCSKKRLRKLYSEYKSHPLDASLKEVKVHPQNGM